MQISHRYKNCAVISATSNPDDLNSDERAVSCVRASKLNSAEFCLSFRIPVCYSNPRSAR